MSEKPHHPHHEIKLGKHPAKHDHKTLRLKKYIKPHVLPNPPPRVDWSSAISAWTMMGNDHLSNCTLATAGHLIQVWTTNIGKPIVLDDDTIVREYSAITGYDPKTGNNNTGVDTKTLLKHWLNNGIGGHRIEAYVALEPSDHNYVKNTIALFGGCFIGLALPLSAKSQAVLWDVPQEGTTGDGAHGSWGCHAVAAVGYDDDAVDIVTGSIRMKMTWNFWQAYCDEAYAVLSPDWINSKHYDPAGVDLKTLRDDLTILMGL